MAPPYYICCKYFTHFQKSLVFILFACTMPSLKNIISVSWYTDFFLYKLIKDLQYIQMHFKMLLQWKQTLWTLIKLLLREQSNLGPYGLQYRLPKYNSRWESRWHLLSVANHGKTVQYYFVCLFVWFDSLRPINNLSVKQEWVFLGWTSTKLG